jgi:hypothetical protein
MTAMSSDLDTKARPAIRLSVGYSALNDKTIKVLAVCDGRIVDRMGPFWVIVNSRLLPGTSSLGSACRPR